MLPLWLAGLYRSFLGNGKNGRGQSFCRTSVGGVGEKAPPCMRSDMAKEWLTCQAISARIADASLVLHFIVFLCCDESHSAKLLSQCLSRHGFLLHAEY